MKTILYIAFALIGLAVLVPTCRSAIHMVTGESAALTQLTAATTPAALRAPGGDEKAMAAAHRILAVAGGQPIAQHAAPAPAPAQPQWVSVGDYNTRL